VRVAGSASVVNTASATLSTTVSSEFISGLPVTGRDYQDVMVLAPRVTGVSAAYSRAQGAFSSIVQGSGGPPGGRQAIQRAVTSPVFCRLGAVRKSYRVGEKIDLYVAIKNLFRKTVKVPAFLSVSGGTALFRILDDEWNAVPGPVSGSCIERKRALLPGEWILFKVTLNGEGGYRLDRPGLYCLVFLGSELGLPDSTQLTLRIDP